MTVSPNVYRRRLRICTEDRQARADLEDDNHRYGVIVTHDSARVLSVNGLTLRIPWTLCHDAAAMLEKLEGTPIGTPFSKFYEHIDAGSQCTHMADLAGLAIAWAGRRDFQRQYDFEVRWTSDRQQQIATMDIDDSRFLEWTIENSHIVSPGRFAGEPLRKIKPVVEAFGDPELTEAVLLFRRAIFISNGKWLDLDSIQHPSETGHASGACYVFQPDVAKRAIRIRGATRDFADKREQMLIDLTD
ncbi:MAG: DUF2889 domain-containing protein [Azonexus sp.]|jgi:hypothetical protein|nr:DUF2889 domain-containing protein [Azonexus sp.]